mmetsp:Transcript_131073/g.261526  ORF Transcript_131073/g.261526 Transcript_131073/m.261526 type:complete len:242 (-) Transcript_131073:459-1184(-)
MNSGAADDLPATPVAEPSPEVNEGVAAGQSQAPAASQMGAAAPDDAANTATSEFWSKALKFGRQASKVGGRAKKAIVEESQQCVNDARGIVDDTRLIARKIAVAVSAGAQLPNKIDFSATANALGQGSDVNARIFMNTQQDVNAGNGIVGSIFGVIRSGWTEPASSKWDGSMPISSTFKKDGKVCPATFGIDEGVEIFIIGSDDGDDEFNESAAFDHTPGEATENPIRQPESLPIEQSIIL